MFLDFFYFEKKKINSAASRNIFCLKNKFKLDLFKKNLFFFKKWNAGRNKSGKIVHYAKKSLLVKNKKININYNYRYLKLGIISNFQYINFFNKILILIIFSNGSCMYINSTQFVKIFKYFFFFKKNFNFFKFKFIFFMLFQIKKLSIISLIELIPQYGAQYVRSSGTFAKIDKINSFNHTILIKLPSLKKKIFSYFSLAFFGKINFRFSIKLQNTKSGFWRAFGSKSIVRGIAKNAVDHPHGGKTKSIKLPKTPWGKITKLK